MKQHRDISLRTIRRAAANADCDVRTALKVALGTKVRGVVGERVAEELRALGVEVPDPAVMTTADDLPARAAGGR